MLRHLLKLSHHSHSGQIRGHEHTSYAALVLILLIVGIALTTYTVAAVRPGPASESIGMSGIMPGDPPTTAATIDSPSSGSRFDTTPVEITGSCPKNTLVEIFKNDIFAGSTQCRDDGRYSIEIDLLIGENDIFARVYDDLNQPGPDSNRITIFYDALPPQGSPLTSFDFGGNQMILNTDAVFRGIFPDQELVVPVEILGGTPPYAVNVQWGDSTNRVVPRNDNTGFNVTHTYRKPGNYPITLQATDSQGRVAFLTVAAIVNGQPEIVATAYTNDGSIWGRLLVLWPLYTSLVAVVISFWLGERREKYILSKRGLLLSS